MSKISTVYDALVTRLGVLFGAKTRIPNPYELSDNNDQFLVNGYGLTISSSDQAPHEFKVFNIERIFNVVFTRELIATDSDETQYDSIAKALLEDVYIVQKDFYNESQVAVESSVENIGLGTSSGIEFVFSGKKRYLLIEVGFPIQIREIL